MEITSENWTHCSYAHGNLKAMITFGGSPDILEYTFIYYVTVLDQDNNEVFQKEFQSLDDACRHINIKYSNMWKLENAIKPKKAGGCSTCIAH
ncbi:MAG: hypothetical protein WEB87_01110 [Bacteriovoracaceae bacterium]